MGRAVNNFTSYVGHAEETISEEKVDLPEKSLFSGQSILSEEYAVLDLINRDINVTSVPCKV